MKTNLLLSFALFVVFSVSAYAQLPTPVADFPFNEDFEDTKSLVYPTVYGDVQIVEDDTRGMVASFPGGSDNGVDGEGQYVDLTTNAYGFAEVTYNVWMKANATDTWARIITFATASGGNEPEAFLAVNNARLSNHLGWTTDGGPLDDGLELEYTSAINLGEWYMITFSQDATHNKLWVNGVMAAEGDQLMGSPAAQTIAHVYLGKSVWPDPLFNGYMDDFRIYDKVLTDAEVLAVYNEAGSGVNDISNNFKPSIYSTNGKIFVKNLNNAKVNSVEVFDILGNSVYKSTQLKSEISANLPSSVYIVKLQSNKGNYQTKVSVR